MNYTTLRQQKILKIIEQYQTVSISEIKKLLPQPISTPSLNRDLAKLVSTKFIVRKGAGRAIRYQISPNYKLLMNYDIDTYFSVDVDLRKGNKKFNFDIFNMLAEINILTSSEAKRLEQLRKQYQFNVKNLPKTIYQKELERLIIELSWKSSQIEGNTYSLLETERLLTEQETVKQKPKEDAAMLLNHKVALNYILANKNEGKQLTLKFLAEIHSLIIKNLGVNKNIRNTPVGITGSFYVPLDNTYQIKENLEKMCLLINKKENIFEKALLSLVLISYIQPFEDGNKRTSRMISNAILIANDACPLSYRSVDAIMYKKATLLFYEQNNITAFKKIFIEQNIFACENYFQGKVSKADNRQQIRS